MSRTAEALRRFRACHAELLRSADELRLAIEAEAGALPEDPRLEYIGTAVARFYCVPAGELAGPSRAADIALARQVAMVLSCELTGLSQSRVGRYFGGRDHGTVAHAIGAVRDRAETNADFATRFADVRLAVVAGMAARAASS